MSESPLGLDPIDAKLIADLRAHAESVRWSVRMFDALPIEDQERIMLEIQKQNIAEIIEAKEARRANRGA